jgi:uncharacterized membrane protein YccC
MLVRSAFASAVVGPLRTHGADLRQAVRVTVGCLIAFVIYHLFNLPQGYWAVFTVVIVMQGSIGGTLGAAIDRMKGTLLGAAIGGLAAWLRPQTPVGLGAALGLSVAVTTLAAALRPTLKVAPVTAVIMLISPAGGTIGPLEAAALRVVEILLGSVIGVATSVLVLPARSRAVIIERAVSALDAMAALARHLAEDLRAPAPQDRHQENSAIRASIGAVEAALADASHERSSRLGDHRISDALPRTLWRTRNDLVAVGRAVAAMPEALRDQLAGGAAAILESQGGFMQRCGEALSREERVDRTGREDALAAFEAVMAALRRSRATHALDLDQAAPVFALAFAIESLERNLTDLTDRIDETAASAG